MRNQNLGPLRLATCLGCWLVATAVAVGQDSPGASNGESPGPNDVPREVQVDPQADDTEIAARLQRILEATGWFREVEVRVDEGVAFLHGVADTQEHREWAVRLARNLQDVVAVVDQLELEEVSWWDFSPAWRQLNDFGAQAVRNTPLVLIGLVLLIITWFSSKWAVRGASSVLQRRMRSQLLRDVVSRAVAVPVFLLGLYLVLKVSGLTGLAVTVIGGTGLIGLVIGFAFRDIAENFLSSVLISLQRPFATGDLIEVADYKGFVQSVNTRSTLLMTLEGNHIQIPNATIYKESITNYTANPNARFDFVVGIGYDDSIVEAQTVVLSVLRGHPAVVDQPEPLVLAESLGAATVNLRVYFWVDMARYSHFKVRSAILRQAKAALEKAGISMPDEAREVVFPAGVPIHAVESTPAPVPHDKPAADDSEAQSNQAEGDLSSEAGEIQQQAQQSRQPEGGENLLDK